VAAISTAWLSELTLALLTIDDNQFTDHQAWIACFITRLTVLVQKHSNNTSLSQHDVKLFKITYNTL
jgi:hypothetical protein